METSPADYQETLLRTWTNSLKGAFGHLEPTKVLDGISVEFAGAQVTNAPYTIWQLLKHLNFWQRGIAGRIAGC